MTMGHMAFELAHILVQSPTTAPSSRKTAKKTHTKAKVVSSDSFKPPSKQLWNDDAYIRHFHPNPILISNLNTNIIFLECGWGLSHNYQKTLQQSQMNKTDVHMKNIAILHNQVVI